MADQECKKFRVPDPYDRVLYALRESSEVRDSTPLLKQFPDPYDRVLNSFRELSKAFDETQKSVSKAAEMIDLFAKEMEKHTDAFGNID